MKNFTSSKLVVLFSLLLVFSNANATLIFTDIIVSSNSISFTVDGDLTGYTAPTTADRQRFFTVGYSDSLCTGCVNFGVNPNTISQSVFSNMNITSSGYTGKWGLE